MISSDKYVHKVQSTQAINSTRHLPSFILSENDQKYRLITGHLNALGYAY